MSSPLFVASHLTKHYGDFRALHDVSLSIQAGEIFALLGPNGAGKTTLIGCVAGLVSDFEGEVQIAGFDVRRDYRTTRRLVGLVPQELNQDVFFNVRDAVAFQGGYFGVRPDDPRIDALLKSFSLEDKADSNTRWLSGGMKRRLMICKALVHDPVLLFLDEPTAGVDVELREELWEYVLALRDRGTTIVLTTHYLEEAERLADRIAILHKGQLRRVSTRDALLADFGEERVVIELSKPLEEGAARSLLAALPGASFASEQSLVIARSRDQRASNAPAASPPTRPLDQLVAILAQHEIGIEHLRSQQSSLEEVFRQVITREDEKDALQDSEQGGDR